jgi:hypothetical protein
VGPQKPPLQQCKGGFLFSAPGTVFFLLTWLNKLVYRFTLPFRETRLQISAWQKRLRRFPWRLLLARDVWGMAAVQTCPSDVKDRDGAFEQPQVGELCRQVQKNHGPNRDGGFC